MLIFDISYDLTFGIIVNNHGKLLSTWPVSFITQYWFPHRMQGNSLQFIIVYAMIFWDSGFPNTAGYMF